MRCALLAAVLWAGPVAAEPPPVFSRGSGFLQVPTAEALRLGGGLLGAEVRLDRSGAGLWAPGPAQLNLAAGLGLGLEAGLSLREGGLPGDPDPSPLFVGARLKFQFLEAEGFRPALALDASLDRFNWLGLSTLRALATLPLGPLTLSGVLGVDLVDVRWGTLGPTGGLSARFSHDVGLGLQAEWWTTPRGMGVAGELRWRVTPHIALSTRATYLPTDGLLRLGLGLVVFAEPPPKKAPAAPAVAPAAVAAVGPRAFRDGQPHFRLKWRLSGRPLDGAGRPTQWDGTGAEPVAPVHRARPAAPEAQAPSAPAVPYQPFAVKPPAAPVEGGSWSENLRLVMKTVEEALRRCWGGGAPAGVGDTVDVALTVDLRGQATGLVVMDPLLRHGPVEACLVRAAQAWRFPPAREPYSLELTVRTKGESKP